MYREIREVQSMVDVLLTHVRDALLATSTRDMVEHNGRAHTSAVSAKEQIDRILSREGDDGGTSFGEPRVESRFVEAANRQLSAAISEAEKIELGVDLESMRERVIDFKTRADYAGAYLRVAVGTDSDQ